MNKLNEEELYEINGGASLTGVLVNAFISTGKFIYSLGQSLGTSIRRIGSGNYCSL